MRSPLHRGHPAVLAAVVLALLAFAVPATAAARRAQRCNGARALCARTFDRVVLPATHNSMSAQALGFRIPNQPTGIPTQLRDGVRGFLMDTHYGRRQSDGTVTTDDDGKGTTGERGLYLCHVLCEIGASPLVPVLRSMRDFLRAHPDNVLLIDQEDVITPQDWAGAVAASGLLRHVYRGSTTRWPTLASMIARHQQVVMLAERRDGGGEVPWNHLDYEGIMQETAYSWPTESLITDPARWAASCAPNRGGTTGSLFLMNHWSPPTPLPVPDPVAGARVNARSVLVGRARACRRVRGKLPTIVAVDQYRTGGLFAAVRALNGVG